MPGKSAFEIRASLLDLAFRILLERARAEDGAKAMASGDEFYCTTAPTTDDVIAEAEKLNSFVSKKSD